MPEILSIPRIATPDANGDSQAIIDLLDTNGVRRIIASLNWPEVYAFLRNKL